MGNQREYIKSGGFSQYLYEDHDGFTPVTINGIRGKVVRFIADKGEAHTGLPTYANSSDIYFRVNRDGEVIQGKVYINRKHTLDFDWGHTHKNADGSVFEKGIVHVQVYSVSQDGVRMSKTARYMNNEEIAKYGAIIHAFNPKVKFRP